VFGGLVAGLFGLAVFGVGALLLYGVVILIFRHAYGVELPNPFSWLGVGWFGRCSSPATPSIAMQVRARCRDDRG
jgi:hypothetical protein